MLQLKNVCVQAENGTEILHDMNLTIPDNRFIALTGPNGGGKSTLAKVIMGILPVASGQLLWNGEDITQQSITRRAQLGIAFSFQQPVRFKGITVHDMIRLSAQDDSLDKTALCNYLREVGLCAKDYISRPIDGSLSGGEIKRIEIATVLARHAPLSIFDEPEAGIDIWSFQNLIDVFQKMRKTSTGSILVISHQERILSIAQEIIILANGRISSRGDAKQMLPKLLCSENKCELFPGKEGELL